jgi:TRAP-type mannitol/chloroaromatic compound transport system permease small subunit
LFDIDNKSVIFIDSVNQAIGKYVARLTIAMVAVTFVIVVLRYGFNLGWIWLQELVTWMHAAVFLLTAAYAFSEDAHVRVDVFYRNCDKNTQHKINLVGSIFCLCPIALLMMAGSLDYVLASWQMKEASGDAGGLAYPFIPLLKTLIPLTGLMLFAQGFSNACSSLLKLKRD